MCSLDMHLAVISNDLDGVRRMIKQGMDLNLTDQTGSTPLSLAASIGNLDIIKALTEAGALWDIVDSFGRHPATLAVINDNLDCLKYLLSHYKKIPVDLVDGQGNTMVLHAARNGHKMVLNHLLELEPEITHCDALLKRNALHWCAILGQTVCLEMLLQYAKKYNLTDFVDCKDSMHQTALMLACTTGWYGLV